MERARQGSVQRVEGVRRASGLDSLVSDTAAVCADGDTCGMISGLVLLTVRSVNPEVRLWEGWSRWWCVVLVDGGAG